MADFLGKSKDLSKVTLEYKKGRSIRIRIETFKILQ